MATSTGASASSSTTERRFGSELDQNAATPTMVAASSPPLRAQFSTAASLSSFPRGVPSTTDAVSVLVSQTHPGGLAFKTPPPRSLKGRHPRCTPDGSTGTPSSVDVIAEESRGCLVETLNSLDVENVWLFTQLEKHATSRAAAEVSGCLNLKGPVSGPTLPTSPTAQAEPSAACGPFGVPADLDTDLDTETVPASAGATAPPDSPTSGAVESQPFQPSKNLGSEADIITTLQERVAHLERKEEQLTRDGEELVALTDELCAASEETETILAGFGGLGALVESHKALIQRNKEMEKELEVLRLRAETKAESPKAEIAFSSAVTSTLSTPSAPTVSSPGAPSLSAFVTASVDSAAVPSIKNSTAARSPCQTCSSMASVHSDSPSHPKSMAQRLEDLEDDMEDMGRVLRCAIGTLTTHIPDCSPSVAAPLKSLVLALEAALPAPDAESPTQEHERDSN